MALPVVSLRPSASPLRLREALWQLPALGRPDKGAVHCQIRPTTNFEPPPRGMQRRCRQNINLRELEVAGSTVL